MEREEPTDLLLSGFHIPAEREGRQVLCLKPVEAAFHDFIRAVISCLSNDDERK